MKNSNRSRNTIDLCGQKKEAQKHRTEWCAVASKDSCMKSGMRSEDAREECEDLRWM